MGSNVQRVGGVSAESSRAQLTWSYGIQWATHDAYHGDTNACRLHSIFDSLTMSASQVSIAWFEESFVYCCTPISSSDDRIQMKKRSYNSNRNRQDKVQSWQQRQQKLIVATYNNLSSWCFFISTQVWLCCQIRVWWGLLGLSIDTVVMIPMIRALIY